MTAEPPRKKIHLIRHAEALHNLTGNTSIVDPPLTPLGLEQAAEIPQTALPARSAQVVIASPLRRTLQTATFGFPEHAAKSGAIVALAELQEAGPNPCDHGDEKIQSEKGFAHVDFQHLTGGWARKEGRNAATHEAHIQRAAYVRRWLRERPEDEIAVVSHWGFLFYMSNPDPLENLGEGWRNTECRTYVFKSPESDELVLLDERQPPSADQSASTPLPNGVPAVRA